MAALKRVYDDPEAVADRAFLSINSIKTYIRSAYRKIGVERRAQAVRWGMNHGFEVDEERKVDPALRVRPSWDRP
jgi:hypothetical protein